MPRRVYCQKPVDIHHLPQMALRDRILQRQYRGRKAKLEVNRRLQPLGPADADDPVRPGQIRPHRFLDDADGPGGKRLQQTGMGRGRRRKVIDRAKAKGRGFGDAGKGAGSGLGRHRLRLGLIGVIDSRDRKPEPGIGRKMGIGHDGPRPEDDHRKAGLRQRKGLPQVSRHGRFPSCRPTIPPPCGCRAGVAAAC